MNIEADNSGTVYREPEVSIDPEICGGDPCVYGHRVPAAMVYHKMKSYGMSLFDISKDYPHVPIDRLDRAVRWIMDHPGYYEAWRREND